VRAGAGAVCERVGNATCAWGSLRGLGSGSWRHERSALVRHSCIDWSRKVCPNIVEAKAPAPGRAACDNCVQSRRISSDCACRAPPHKRICIIGYAHACCTHGVRVGMHVYGEMVTGILMPCLCDTPTLPHLVDTSTVEQCRLSD